MTIGAVSRQSGWGSSSRTCPTGTRCPTPQALEIASEAFLLSPHVVPLLVRRRFAVEIVPTAATRLDLSVITRCDSAIHATWLVSRRIDGVEQERTRTTCATPESMTVSPATFRPSSSRTRSVSLADDNPGRITLIPLPAFRGSVELRNGGHLGTPRFPDRHFADRCLSRLR